MIQERYRSLVGAALAVLLLQASVGMANSGGITGRSGKQGLTCTSCHGSGGPFNYQLPSLSGPTTVTASTTQDYTLNFNLNSGTLAGKAGFNLAVSDSGGSLNIDTGASPVRKANLELTHSTPALPNSGNFSWNFKWTAPASAGMVSFFACTNPVNGNGASSGDGSIRCAEFPISVTVAAAAPAAANDSYSTSQNGELSVPVPGVLGNDTDANGDALTAVVDATTSQGVLVLNPDGSFTYTPEADYSGPDSFTYYANDGALNSPVATVNIVVGVSNNSPVAANDNYSGMQDTTRVVAAPGVLANDTDADDGDTLSAIIVNRPLQGDLTLDEATGGFSYVPNPGFSGTDSFTYQVSDGLDQSNVATVTLTMAATPPPPSGGGGGGGSTPLSLNLILLIVALSVRRGVLA